MIRCTMDRLSVASPSLASKGYRQKSCNRGQFLEQEGHAKKICSQLVASLGLQLRCLLLGPG